MNSKTKHELNQLQNNNVRADFFGFALKSDVPTGAMSNPLKNVKL